MASQLDNGPMSDLPRERILFVTGRLAEGTVRRIVGEVAARAGFEYEVCVLPISVAALMHTDWVSRKLTLDGHYDRVLLPGYCQGPVAPLQSRYGVRFDVGPKDIRDLGETFGQARRAAPDLSQYDIEILAEINHAPRMTEREILAAARRYRESGADVIDLGCVPGESWSRVGEVVRILCAEGCRVSIDSFDQREVAAAVDAGAELVLSVNQSNVEWASRLGGELVAIPDSPEDLDSLGRTIDVLQERGCPYRIDPIIEPIGFGFAESLARYYESRRRWPAAEIMMGVGNITEMTEVDSAGVNLLLAAICQELRVQSVLTTEVINWARSSVLEFDAARRLVKYANDSQTLPKHVESGLVMLRDARLQEFGPDELTGLARQLTDPNYRIFVERDEIHIMNREGYWRGRDPFELFDGFSAAAKGLDASHAFYLGYELSKAVTALNLGKQYTQDQALQWGLLTVREASSLERRHQSRKNPGEQSGRESG